MSLAGMSFASGRRLGGAHSWSGKRGTSRLGRRGVSAAGVVVALFAIAAPASALATDVPAAVTLNAHLVTVAPTPGAPVRSVPLRVQDPAQYARDKAAA